MSDPAYTNLPNLRTLIGHDGIPGVEYAIIDTSNLLRAQKEGWEEISQRGSRVFPIRGPLGESACKLLGRGKPIPGQQLGVVCHVFVDRTVKERTGLGIEEEKPAEATKPAEPAKPVVVEKK